MDPSTWTTVEHIFRDLLIFVAVMTALLIALVVIVSYMPDDTPLKRVFSALSYRVGATAALGALALPIEPIPGIGEVYDIGAPILLLWYWYTFFRDIRAKSPLLTPKPRIGLDKQLSSDRASRSAWFQPKDPE
jgi:hypothetical protein